MIYGIQFIVLLFLANRLGPYNYGRWGFFLLIYGYFAIINMGIPNSVDVLLVQNKSDENQFRAFVKSSYVAIGLLGVFISLVAILYFLFPLNIFQKYHFGNLFYIVCVIAFIHHFNTVFGKIYRIKNRLLELAVNQSLIPVFILVFSCFLVNTRLFNALIGVYFFSQIISFAIYIIRGGLPMGGQMNYSYVKDIFEKGFYLFVYNSCFYLIFTTTSTIVSFNYSVEEYGYYTFSYSLGHSVLLILEAFASISFPKIIDKLYSGHIGEVKSIFSRIFDNYVVFSHGLMYVAFAIFPSFIVLFPKYEKALPALCITSLIVVLSTNAFAYSSFLIAKNDEKKISIIALMSLITNIILGLLLVNIGVPFYCVIVSMAIGYLLFSYLCVRRAFLILEEPVSPFFIIHSILPFRLFIPFLIGMYISITGEFLYVYLPLIIYIVLNLKTLKTIFKTIIKIAQTPTIIDLKTK